MDNKINIKIEVSSESKTKCSTWKVQCATAIKISYFEKNIYIFFNAAIELAIFVGIFWFLARLWVLREM